MPPFVCEVCQVRFDVPPSALARYPGWRPKRCAEHSAARKGKPRRTRRPREENLSVARTLARHPRETGGPDTGVFTDGSASPNPGPGGWGVVWVEAGQVRLQAHGHEPRTTNNRMELTALIEAYRRLPEDVELSVYTDSRLCVDTILRWAPGWERKGWRKQGGPIKNLELVQELLALHRGRPGASLEWIPAHSGKRWNEVADSLATAWMRDEV